MADAFLHPELRELKGRRVAFMASTGGHLEQALRWSDRLGVSDDSVFITFDGPQAIGLLQGRQKYFVQYISPRSTISAAKASLQIVRHLISLDGIEAVVSTGASIAVSAYLPVLLRGLPFYYIESVSRFYGPSLSGRLVAPLPRVKAFTQHSRYQSSRWRATSGLLDDWKCVPPKGGELQSSSVKIFVTLGTIRPYAFHSVVAAIRSCVSPLDDVVWQLGVTDEVGLPGKSFDFVTSDEFDEFARRADVVVSHAGVGSLMRLFDLGISPIVVPRRAERGEHVDDHQVQAARELAQIGLVTTVESDELDFAMLHSPRPTIQKTRR